MAARSLRPEMVKANEKIQDNDDSKRVERAPTNLLIKCSDMSTLADKLDNTSGGYTEFPIVVGAP